MSSVIMLLLLSVGYLDVEVVGSQDQLKEGSLVHLSEKGCICERAEMVPSSPNLEKISAPREDVTIKIIIIATIIINLVEVSIPREDIIIIIFNNLEEVRIPRGDVISPLLLVLIILR